MAYDPVKTANLLNTIGHYSRMPGAEFIQSLGSQLKEAEAMANEAFVKIRAATADKTNTESMFKSEVAAHAETVKERDRFCEALEQIKSGKEKVAKKIATLALNPPAPATTVPANATELPVSTD